MAEKKLETMRGFSTGVRDNAAVRMAKLGRPICPNSKLKMVKNDEGKWVAAENQPQNCQLSDEPGWWERCQALGHDPYFTNAVWYEPQDVTEEDEDGNLIVTGTKKIKHINRYPNIAQVAIGVRHNSGQGAKNKVKNAGFVRLADLGLEEVCQYRNCQKPVDPKFHNTTYGSYCGVNHTSLIAADTEGIMLHYPDVKINGPEHSKIKKARERQLREALSGA